MPAENISAPHNDRDLNPGTPDFLDLPGKPDQHLRVNTEAALLALQHFATQFQKHPLEFTFPDFQT